MKSASDNYNRSRECQTTAIAQQQGFSMIDIMAAITVLVIGVMGFAGMVTNSLLLSRSSLEVDRANNALMNIAEDFRAACAEDFDSALANHGDNPALTAPAFVGKDTIITSTLVLDESSVTPNIDLNGDGDTSDSNVSIANTRAGVLRISINWQGVISPMSLEYTTIVARSQIQ
jgi:Tfp pilus assembly protein PilV